MFKSGCLTHIIWKWMFEMYESGCLARVIWKWMFKMFESGCLAHIIWKWMFGSYYLKVDVLKCLKVDVWLVLFESECSKCLKGQIETENPDHRVLFVFDRTFTAYWGSDKYLQTFNTYFYTMQKYLLCGQKWSKRCLIHESRVCLSGASAYQQVHFQRIQRIKVHGCFLHPDKVKLLCLGNLILTEMFRGREMMIKHFGLYLGTP